MYVFYDFRSDSRGGFDGRPFCWFERSSFRNERDQRNQISSDPANAARGSARWNLETSRIRRFHTQTSKKLIF